MSSDPERTVTAQRRRRTDAQPGGREQAQTPVRRDDSGSGGSGGSGGGGGYRPPSSGGGGTKMSPLMAIGLLLLLLICGGPVLLMNGLFGGGASQEATEQAQVQQEESDTGSSDTSAGETNSAESASAAQQQEAPVAPTPRPTPIIVANAAAAAAAIAAAPATSGQTWTIMLYQDADDKILERDIYTDLNEAERSGSTDRVNVVAQVDRFRGGYNGDGDWTGTRRYHVTRDQNLGTVKSELVEDLGEVNMADGDTLVDFVSWAAKEYPADKYVLILSDHGMGWPGGWSDPDPKAQANNRAPLAQAIGNNLFLSELDDALAKVQQTTDIDKFELIGMDACLMGHIEVMSALEPYANYAVVSQETEPALGWAYTSFLNSLSQNPDMTGAELSTAIVTSYIKDDQRILDDAERAAMTGRNPMGSLFASGPSAQDVANQMGRNVTLTAADLSQVPALMAAVNDLSFQLQNSKQQSVAKARTYAQSFTSIFGSDVPPSYIDLGHFVSLLKQTIKDPNVNAAADRVLQAIGNTVVAEKRGPDKPGANGVSIYFPNSQLYSSPVAGAPSYTALASRFATDSLWDEFLAYHYSGKSFKETNTRVATVPDAGAATRAPGAGAITLSPVEVSSKTTSIGEPVLMSTNIDGENLGYVYFFTGFYDQNNNSIFVADQDYLESADTRELGGVYYPDWGEGAFKMQFDWEPLMFGINDGQKTVNAALKPESYGALPEQAVYSVDGIYTYADGGEQRQARLYFQDQKLQQVMGFTGNESGAAPREIQPQTGDTFTIQETWLDLDSSGNITKRATKEGETLTFGDQMFTWRELDAAPGEYVVGFIAEDLDGNRTEAYNTVTVQ